MNHTLQSLSKLSGTDFYIDTKGLGTIDMIALCTILIHNDFEPTGRLIYANLSGVRVYSDKTFGPTFAGSAVFICKIVNANDILVEHHESYLAQKQDQKQQSIYSDTVLPVDHPDYDRIMVHALD